MARVHISLSEEELARFREQAEQEGMSLSAWLHAAAKRRMAEKSAKRHDNKRVHTDEDREAFFRMIDALHGPDAKPTPTWEEINRMLEQRMREKFPQA